MTPQQEMVITVNNFDRIKSDEMTDYCQLLSETQENRLPQRDSRRKGTSSKYENVTLGTL